MDATVGSRVGVELSREVLAGFPGRDAGAELDWGIPLLARLMLAGDEDRAVARAVVLAWAAGHRGRMTHAGLFGCGLAGYAVGLAHAAVVDPRLARVADAARGKVVSWCAERGAAGQGGLSFVDYDLILGMSGVVLALASLPGCRPEHLSPGVRYLVARCHDPALPGLVITGDGGDPRTRWCIGQLNHGLAHGVPGVLAALVAAWPLTRAADRDAVAAAVGTVARYLARIAAADSRGVLTWAPASGQQLAGRSSRRQAWCYGAPGIAWQLAEAGRVLDDQELRARAVASFASLCAAWDDDYYLAPQPGSSRLAFCHGAAGTVAVARAFSGNLGLATAGLLAEHLSDLLSREAASVRELARADLTFLSGGTGILAVQLARCGAWQLPLGLGGLDGPAESAGPGLDQGG